MAVSNTAPFLAAASKTLILAGVTNKQIKMLAFFVKGAAAGWVQFCSSVDGGTTLVAVSGPIRISADGDGLVHAGIAGGWQLPLSADLYLATSTTSGNVIANLSTVSAGGEVTYIIEPR